ncbi:YybH family protein [Spirochaeta isovalerica]|uniref:Ketosteroid isomerase-like protein n=1 Tax=Spirochaeta isovalerica TaxID=150 RepID=A0A841RDY5_9SPIO|nr:nuclear transport factor 2 family protein [Spirochaeta isovalerica]MBB6482275.1 ketosteroid isomerase-like protein [Spirochaeta isovalerica]
MADKFDKADLIKEIKDTEAAFCRLAAERGIAEAFLTYADDGAVINRNNRIYRGKAGIAEYYDNQTLKDVQLTWSPDYVDVAESGDMAWTYGNYVFAALSDENKPVEARGIFHTVWKRQPGGTWKYVWD